MHRSPWLWGCRDREGRAYSLRAAVLLGTQVPSSAATVVGVSPSFCRGGDETFAHGHPPRENWGPSEGKAQALWPHLAPLSTLLTHYQSQRGTRGEVGAPCARTTPCPCSAESCQDPGKCPRGALEPCVSAS